MALRTMAPMFRLRPDEDKAFERLYERHVKDVYRYAAAMLGEAADAEDVTQTTFLNAYRAFKTGTRPEKPQSWLIAIAHNVCRQRFRQAQRRPHEVAFDDGVGDGTEPHDPAVPSAEDLRRALSQLPANQRAALIMRELEGCSYAEIAEVLGVSVSALETLLFRARRALREQLDEQLTCQDAGLAINKQLDGRLSLRERRALRAHLRACAECNSLAHSQRAQRKALKALVLVPLPATVSHWFGNQSAAAATGTAGAGGLVATGAATSGGVGAASAVLGGVAVKAAAVVIAGVAVAGGTYAGIEGGVLPGARAAAPPAAQAKVEPAVPRPPAAARETPGFETPNPAAAVQAFAHAQVKVHVKRVRPPHAAARSRAARRHARRAVPPGQLVSASASSGRMAPPGLVRASARPASSHASSQATSSHGSSQATSSHGSSQAASSHGSSQSPSSHSSSRSSSARASAPAHAAPQATAARVAHVPAAATTHARTQTAPSHARRPRASTNAQATPTAHANPAPPQRPVQPDIPHGPRSTNGSASEELPTDKPSR